MAATVVFESRLPGSDGAYTDQKVVLLDADTALGWFMLEHDLGRIPDWVRVTKLTYGLVNLDPWDGPATAAGAHLEPAIDIAASLLTDRLVWDVGTGTPGTGRPPEMPAGHDLSTDLWFGAAGDETIPPNGDPGHTGQDAYYLVEVGITHSVSK